MSAATPLHPDVYPQNLEAEDHVLGASMLNSKTADTVIDELNPDWLSRPSNRVIYHAIAYLRQQGLEAEPIALIHQIQQTAPRDGDTDWELRVRTLCYISWAGNVRHWIHIIREEWARRQAIITAGQVAAQVRAGAQAEEAIGRLEYAALELRHEYDHGRQQSIWTGKHAADDLEALVNNPPDEEPGVQGPYRGLLDRLNPGQLYVIGAYPGDGKSITAIQTMKAAADTGARVGLVTLEMTKQDLRNRLVSTWGIPVRQLRSGRILTPYLAAYQAALEWLRSHDVQIIDDAWTSSDIHRIQRVRKYDLLIIDFLQRLRINHREDNYRLSLNDEIHAITDIAKHENVPVLLLSQFHRPAGATPRPTLQSFKESSTIEEDADHAYAVWRVWENGKKTKRAEWIVLKERHDDDTTGGGYLEMVEGVPAFEEAV